LSAEYNLGEEEAIPDDEEPGICQSIIKSISATAENTKMKPAFNNMFYTEVTTAYEQVFDVILEAHNKLSHEFCPQLICNICRATLCTNLNS
jgi:hypothetical protein